MNYLKNININDLNNMLNDKLTIIINNDTMNNFIYLLKNVKINKIIHFSYKILYQLYITCDYEIPYEKLLILFSRDVFTIDNIMLYDININRLLFYNKYPTYFRYLECYVGNNKYDCNYNIIQIIIDELNIVLLTRLVNILTINSNQTKKNINNIYMILIIQISYMTLIQKAIDFNEGINLGNNIINLLKKVRVNSEEDPINNCIIFINNVDNLSIIHPYILRDKNFKKMIDIFREKLLEVDSNSKSASKKYFQL